jgi:two-component sensor histidine kinase
MSAGTPFPEGAEPRLAAFAELVATAIANTTARTELEVSRARIIAAGDEARRRIERNLHDGVQQRLVALRLDTQQARAAIPEDEHATRATLLRIEQDLQAILEEVREVSRGLHPPLLSRLGLGPSLQALAQRAPIPVNLEVDLPERLGAPVETAVYYVVSEALTNAIKHSDASEILITITGGQKLHASIIDNGVGGADADGSGWSVFGIVSRHSEAVSCSTVRPRSGRRSRLSFPFSRPLLPESSRRRRRPTAVESGRWRHRSPRGWRDHRQRRRLERRRLVRRPVEQWRACCVRLRRSRRCRKVIFTTRCTRPIS